MKKGSKKNITTTKDDALLADQAEETVETTESAEETSQEDAVETVEAPVPTASPKKAGVVAAPVEQPSVDVSQKDKEDLVVVTMHETIDPAPRIGKFKFSEQLGITALLMRKNYRVPKFVAEVLVDARKATYINIE